MMSIPPSFSPWVPASSVAKEIWKAQRILLAALFQVRTDCDTAAGSNATPARIRWQSALSFEAEIM